MSILWCGGEDIDFLVLGSLIPITNAGYFRSGYARCAMSQPLSGALGKGLIFPGGAVTSAWLSFIRYSYLSNNTSHRFVGFVLSGTSKGLFVGSDNTIGTKLALYKYDGTTWTELASEGGNSLATGTIQKIDMQVIDYGANAYVNVYLNGSLLIAYGPGNVTVSGMTNFDCIGIGPNISSYAIAFSEFIVADEDTRTFGLVTMAPSAAGDANAWTGLYSTIDETTLDDSDVVYVNTNDQDVQYNLVNFPAGTFGVKAVEVAARATKSSGSTPGTLKLGIKEASVNVDAGQTVTTGWATYLRLMQTDPIKAAAWLQSDMNSLQIDLQSAA